MAEWMPIESAPRDGTVIWVIDDGSAVGLGVPYQYAAYWAQTNQYQSGGVWIDQLYGSACNPHHWMPLPEPPEVQK